MASAVTWALLQLPIWLCDCAVVCAATMLGWSCCADPAWPAGHAHCVLSWLVALPAPVCCRVTEVSPPAITLAPHPNPGVHPLAYQRALRHAQRLAAAAAAGEEDEGAEEDSDAEGTAVLFVGELDCWVVGYQLLCKVACLV